MYTPLTDNSTTQNLAMIDLKGGETSVYSSVTPKTLPLPFPADWLSGLVLFTPHREFPAQRMPAPKSEDIIPVVY